MTRFDTKMFGRYKLK